MSREPREDDDVPADVFRLMSGILTPRGIERWWRMPIEELSGMSPKEAYECDEGCRADLRDLIDGYTNPSFT